MQAILAVTVPFFALVLCGYLAGRIGLLPELAIPGLNVFVLYFALPCMLFRFGASLPVAEIVNPSVIVITLLAATLLMIATIALTRSDTMPMKDAALGALTVAWPNTGFMGVPMLAALLGPAAAGPVITTLLVDLFFTSSLCIALAQSQSADGSGIRVGRLLKGTLANPLPAAIALGLVFSALSLRLPGPIDTIVKMLGDSATPVALFTIGTVLWRAGLHVHTRTPLRRFLPLALAKLLAHPLLVLVLGLAAMQIGAPLAPSVLTVIVLAASLPSASAVSLLAERYGADNGRIARVIISSTVIASVTFPLLAWLFDVRPG
ncbi:MAG TPA: AEC family transporter [Burkholderiaceae bacterium]|nr:AEC family transporter [Burkholderiaceae bacterium]HQR71430.1 AEC family transporter [Burkholderiaceae bacterium]